MRKRILMVLAALAVSLAVANAAVFVYYPANVAAYPQKPEVVFAAGTNAGRSDLSGKTITVTIDTNATTASIEVHPTLEYTYYYDILQVKNNGAQTYYVNFYINSTNYTAAFAEAYLVINGQKYPITAGNFISNTNFALGQGQSLSIGLLFYAPDDTRFPDNNNDGTPDKVVIDIQLVYSPTNETPQTLP